MREMNHNSRQRIVYVSRISYPDTTAMAIQTIHMAAAFSSETGEGHLFVADLNESKKTLIDRYAVSDSPLRLWSLHSRHLFPSIYPIIYRVPFARDNIRNSVIAANLCFNPLWRRSKDVQNVLFVRTSKEAMYWGSMRPHLRPLRDWKFVLELHDMAVTHVGSSKSDYSKRASGMKKALLNFDLMTTVTAGLADDIEGFLDEKMRPVLVPNSSHLDRIPERPSTKIINRTNDDVTIGYIGTIDQLRGVDHIITALKFMPENIKLRMVGRVQGDVSSSGKPEWLDRLLKEPALSNRVELAPYVEFNRISDEIDRSDILIQPAGLSSQTTKYAAPLKLFDYMARGKPIVAARTACHLEFLTDGSNCLMYEPGDPKDLAARVMSLVKSPEMAQAVATAAWDQSKEHRYPDRARRILDLVKNA